MEVLKQQLPQLLTRQQAAEALGVSVQTVARLIRRGQLETRRVGERMVRIPAESLERYVEKGGAQ